MLRIGTELTSVLCRDMRFFNNRAPRRRIACWYLNITFFLTISSFNSSNATVVLLRSVGIQSDFKIFIIDAHCRDNFSIVLNVFD